MKKTRKLWLGGMIVAMVVAATCGIVAGCGKAKGNDSTDTGGGSGSGGGGGSQKVEAELTLDVGSGGTLSTTEYNVEVGANLKEFLADKAPTPAAGLTFAGWYLNGSPIADGATMSKDGVELTAKYNAGYTINIYMQAIDESYPDVADKTLSASAFYLDPVDVTSAVTIPEGFALDETESTLSVDALQANYAFNVYLSRNHYSVLFYANIEGDDEEQRVAEYLPYGDTIAALGEEAFDLSDVRRLVGWANDDGEIIYDVGDEITVNGLIVLYAVWDIGYTDLYGGEDVIYFSGEDDTVAHLVRGGMEFEGVRDGDAFTFEPDEGEPLEGKIIGRYFSYDRKAVAGTYHRYSAYLGNTTSIDASSTLVLDGTTNATYTHKDEKDETKNVEEKGVYYPDEERGVYVLETEEYVYRFKLQTVDGQETFSLIDNVYGEYHEGLFISVEGYFSIDEDVYLYFDGIGNAEYTVYGSSLTYLTGKYRIDNIYGNEGSPQRLYLIEVDLGGNFGRTMVMTVPLTSGEVVFVVQDDYAGDYTATVDGEEATINLSGFSALLGGTITVGEKETECYYWAREIDVLGITIIDIYDEKNNLLYSYTIDEDGESLSVNVYGNFTEYLMLDIDEYGDPNLYYPAMLLYDEPYEDAENADSNIPEGAKRAEIYSVVVSGQSREIKHAASGYYTVKEIGGELLYYTYVETEKDAEYTGNAIFTKLGFLTANVGLDVYYYFEVEDELACIEVSEAGAEEGEGGYIWYGDLGMRNIGSLYVDSDGTAYGGNITGFDEDADLMYLDLYTYDPETGDPMHIYFIVTKTTDTEGNETYTYVVAQDAPHTYYYKNSLGVQSYVETLFLNGNGSAVYTKNGVAVNGTYAEKDETEFGDVIYTFTPAEGTQDVAAFDFICYYASYYLYDSDHNGIYTGADGSELLLDGFAFWAEYTDENGVTYGGYYNLEQDGKIRFYDDKMNEFRFTVDGDTIALYEEPVEFADSYSIVDSSYQPVEGYEGHIIVFNADGTVELKDDQGEVKATGKWVVVDELHMIYDVTLQLGETEETKVTWNVKLDDEGSYGVYCVLSDEVMEGSYIGPRYSVLNIDGFGDGYYIDEMGIYNKIVMTIVNEDYLIISEINGAFRYLISYDVAAKSFHRVDNSKYAATFYSDTFTSSIVFGESYVMIDGELYGYYVVEEGEETATVYVRDEDTGVFSHATLSLPKAGEKTYTWNEKKYYRWTEGEEISISGQVDFFGYVDPLDITLTFIPDGSPELNASATITYQDAEGQESTVGGFDIYVEVLENRDGTEEFVLTIYDSHYGDYAIKELKWDPDNEENNALTIQGYFLYDDVIEDVAGYSEIDFGYFGIGDVLGTGEMVMIITDAVDTNDEYLQVILTREEYDEALKSPVGTNIYYGSRYSIWLDSTDDNEYCVEFFLVTANFDPWEEGQGTPYLLVYTVNLYQFFEAQSSDRNSADGISTLGLSIQTSIFGDAFEIPEGTVMSAGLFSVPDDGSDPTYLEPAHAEFLDDGTIVWAIYDTTTEDDLNDWEIWWIILTEDETTGAITGFTNEPLYRLGYLDNSRSYYVNFLYVILTGQSGAELEVPCILGMGTYNGSDVSLFDITAIEEIGNGIWSVETGSKEKYVVTFELVATSQEYGISITVSEYTDQHVVGFGNGLALGYLVNESEEGDAHDVVSLYGFGIVSQGEAVFDPDAVITMYEDGVWVVDSTLGTFLVLISWDASENDYVFGLAQGHMSNYVMDSTRQYAVLYFYSLYAGDDGQAQLDIPYIFQVGKVEGSTAPELPNATYTPNDDGTWTVTSDGDTYIVEFTLGQTDQGYTITVTVTKQEAEPAPVPGTGEADVGGDAAGAQG